MRVRFIFVALCLGVVSFYGELANAYDCGTGYYRLCQPSPQYGDAVCDDCDCERCPDGYTSEGWEEVFACRPNNETWQDACYKPVDKCSGYSNCPAGVGTENQKCKKIGGCTNMPDCQKYVLCDTSNGTKTYDVTGNCYLDGDNTCHANPVPSVPTNPTPPDGIITLTRDDMLYGRGNPRPTNLSDACWTKTNADTYKMCVLNQ